MSDLDIRVFDWSPQSYVSGSSQHALFNSMALAEAGRLDGNEPFCIAIDRNQYLAFKRNASAVVGGMSLDDMLALLSNTSPIRNALLEKGIRSLSLTSWNAENSPGALCPLLDQQCQIRFEFLLNTAHYSRSKISSNHKRNIKKAEKSKLKVTFPVDSLAVSRHIELVNANLTQKGVGGLSNSPEYFQLLNEQGAALLAQIMSGDELLASTFFYANGDYCYYHSSGTNERGKQLGTAHFLVDSMIAEMQERGIQYLNLGGCTSDQSGLYRFKMGFRPETRILVSGKRRLDSGGRSKLRSLLSISAKDIVKTTSVQVFVKNLEEQSPEIESGYAFSKLSFDELFQAVASNPELSGSLDLFCKGSSLCYGLYGDKGQLIALGFTDTLDGAKETGWAVISASPGSVEIGSLYVIQSMRNRGVGTALVAYLEAEAAKTASCRAYCRVDADNLAAKGLLLTRGFISMGEEKLVSTALLPGKQFAIGTIEI